MDDKIIPFSRARKGGSGEAIDPATCAFMLQGLEARLERIQAALITGVNAGRKSRSFWRTEIAHFLRSHP